MNQFENAPVDGATRLIFVRHAQTDANAKHYLQGQTDGVLNETGLAQASSIAKHLKSFSSKKFTQAIKNGLSLLPLPLPMSTTWTCRLTPGCRSGMPAIGTLCQP